MEGRGENEVGGKGEGNGREMVMEGI